MNAHAAPAWLPRTFAPHLLRWVCLLSLGGTSAALGGDALPWQRFDPRLASAFRALVADPDVLRAETAPEDDDPPGPGAPPGRPVAFDPLHDLSAMLVDLNGDGRPEVFLHPVLPTPGSRPPFAYLMQARPRGGWRVLCRAFDQGIRWATRNPTPADATAAPPGGGAEWRWLRNADGSWSMGRRLPDEVRVLRSRSLGWHDIRTSEGTFRWRPGPGKTVRCEPDPTARPDEAVLSAPSWTPFDETVAAAPDDFRRLDHPLARAVARTPDRQGGPGPRDFDGTRHLLYRVADLDGDGVAEVVLLFAWAPAMRGGLAPGVVMRRAGGEGGRWSLGCDVAAPPSRRLATGPAERFRIGAVTYAWEGREAGRELVCTAVPGSRH